MHQHNIHRFSTSAAARLDTSPRFSFLPLPSEPSASVHVHSVKMSAVERVEYMDNQKSSMMAEAIQKEKRIQRAFLKDQEAAGAIKPFQPEPKKTSETRSLVDTVGLPSYMQTVQEDPIQQMNTSISKHMWTSNPGYLVRDGPHMTSRFKQDFAYDQEELDYLRSEGYLEKKHNRRRDDFVSYVEAAAKSRALARQGGGGAGQ